LDISAANAEAIAAALTNTTNFEQLSLNSAGGAGAAVVATRFGTIDTVRLDRGTAGAYGVTMQAGTVTVGIGDPSPTPSATLGGTLTVTDTGTATNDVLNLINRDTDTTSLVNNYASRSITSAGYETVNLSTGTTATTGQSVGVVTINNDSTSAANTLNISGANSLTLFGAPTSNSSGLFTINASGLTGTAALTMLFPPAYSVATGTLSITGSANADTLLGTAATAATIAGGAGNDSITGGTAADSISGEAGDDVILANGGNDTVAGGDGNDTITVAAGTVNVDGGAGNDSVDVAGTLSAGDTVAGGEGTDTLIYLAGAAGVAAASATGVSGFETLQFGNSGANNAQGLEQFVNNGTFTRLNYAQGNWDMNVTNAGAAVTTLQLGSTTGTDTFARLVNTANDTVTIVPETGGARTVTALVLTHEDAVTINTGATAGDTLTITTLTAANLKSLTATGSNAVTITNAIAGAASLATVDATGLTANFTADASASTANLTATGSFTGANTLVGGTGADTITGGTAADSLTGGNGGDSIKGGAGADTINGGLGNDVILGEIGSDTIVGGSGNDTLTGGENADTFRFEANQAANGIDTITDFVVGTDKLDLITTNAVVAAGGAVRTTTTAVAADALVLADNAIEYISMNGAAANLTTAGTATLTSTDLTATTLTNLATYLDEAIKTSGANGEDAIIVVNWTAGGSTTSYVYEFIEANANTTIQAAELTLLGVVTRDKVLAAGDVI
jgi:Ca2+-binding RTX toxin-like protein